MKSFHSILVGVVLLVTAQAASATFIGDSVDVLATNPFETIVSDTATVGPGVEFTGTDVFGRDYDIDLDANSIVFTVSKDSAAGNFTGVLSTLMISNIDFEVLGVSLNAASSACSFGSVSTAFTATSITIDGCNLNTPATALSQSLIFDVVFGDRNVTAVPEPATGVLLGVGLLVLACMRRRRLDSLSPLWDSARDTAST